jgi:hypothetical protein
MFNKKKISRNINTLALSKFLVKIISTILKHFSTLIFHFLAQQGGNKKKGFYLRRLTNISFFQSKIFASHVRK